MRFPKSSDTSENAALLAALCRPGLAFTKDQLQTFPLTEKMVLEMFGTAVEESGKAANGSAKPGKTGSVLATYCTDKTAQAEAGKLDPILGRDKEVRQMVEILGRRTTPNVVLLGEPGVGKSALVEGFALNIAQGNVPERLKGARVFELDIGALVAGASYKGETEDRLKKIIKEVQQYPNAILFIDEVHVLMDPQGSAGKGLADILKPELARGGLTVVAATTNEEYRKYMERDDAFARRFGVVRIEEPDPDMAARMLEAILPNYEKHHKLGIENAAIIGAVELAKRYVKDRCLPASAVGLMDQTMSAVRLLMDTSGSELEKLEKELDGLTGANQQGGVDLAKELDWFELRMGRSLSPILLAMLEEGKKEEAADTPRAEILKDRIVQPPLPMRSGEGLLHGCGAHRGAQYRHSDRAFAKRGARAPAEHGRNARPAGHGPGPCIEHRDRKHDRCTIRPGTGWQTEGCLLLSGPNGHRQNRTHQGHRGTAVQ
ncbi:MAG: ATP-dependent Clp protease ATP-binding subunit [Flavobacteriales bacterium]|nr:ATP-dependent Clp protease ATP-binding subunit [Flavobacteriales bacterium]